MERYKNRDQPQEIFDSSVTKFNKERTRKEPWKTKARGSQLLNLEGTLCCCHPLWMTWNFTGMVTGKHFIFLESHCAWDLYLRSWVLGCYYLLQSFHNLLLRCFLSVKNVRSWCVIFFKLSSTIWVITTPARSRLAPVRLTHICPWSFSLTSRVKWNAL